MVNTEIRLIVSLQSKMEKLYTVSKNKTRSWLWLKSRTPYFIAKFRLKLKKVGKTTRPFRYDLNQIPYDYIVKVTSRFKGLDLTECLKNYGQKFITLYRKDSESKCCSVISDSLRPYGLYSSWNSLGQNTGMGSLSLLQGIFPTQGSNPGLPDGRWILYQLSHKGSPRILEWVAYSFSRGSSQPRNQTGVSCIVAKFFTNWMSYKGSPRQWSKPSPKKGNAKRQKEEEALQIAEKRREAKNKGEKERYIHLNAEFQRIASRDKKAFLSEQCKEIEENNRMGKTRGLPL